MKQQKLFHLVLSAMLIVCTTGCYDKDEIKDAEKYLFKDIQYSFEEGDGFSTYDVELLPFIMENNLNNSITTTNSPFEDTWQETTFQSNDPEAKQQKPKVQTAVLPPSAYNLTVGSS